MVLCQADICQGYIATFVRHINGILFGFDPAYRQAGFPF